MCAERTKLANYSVGTTSLFPCGRTVHRGLLSRIFPVGLRRDGLAGSYVKLGPVGIGTIKCRFCMGSSWKDRKNPLETSSRVLMRRRIVFLLVPLTCLPFSLFVLGMEEIWEKDFSQWTLAEATRVLNKSPWARQQTYTRVLEGVGSGIHGEKEIFNTFFVRLLSAHPIRQAYARIQQIQHGYDEMSQAEKDQLDVRISPGLRLNVNRWVILTLGFRSNNPSMELSVKRFLEAQTLETMRDRVYLFTEDFPRIGLVAYFPPREEAVGAKFVFPREISGEPIVSSQKGIMTFEANIPSVNRRLRVSFSIPSMMVKGALVL